MKHLLTKTIPAFLALSLALLASCDKTTREESYPADESTIPAYTATLEQKIITAAAEACVEINDAVQKTGGIDILFAEEFSYEGKGYTSLTVPADAVKEAGESPDRKAFVFTFKNGEVVSLPYQGEVALAFPEEKDFTNFPLAVVEVPFMVTKAGHGELSVTVRSLAGHPAGNTEPEVEYIPTERKGTLRFTLPEQANTKISFTLTLTDGTNKADYTVTGSTYHFEWVGPKEVVIGGEQGSTAECNVSVKTGAPGITVRYDCEGDFFSLDGETVMATGDNEADDERVGRIVFSESTGKFGTLEVAVHQKGMKPKAVDGCVPFDTWAFKRAAVAQADADRDGEVSLVEAHAVKELNLANLGLETVEELRYFDRMEKVDLSGNKLKKVDFGSISSFSFLRDIDVRNNERRLELNCGGCWIGIPLSVKIDEQYALWTSNTYYDYSSTDETVCGIDKLQSHTKGKGIIVDLITEDMYDVDYYSGGAQSLAQLTMEQFFAIEPFRSLREYFDVYHKKMLKGFSVIPTDEEHELASSGGVFSLTVYISQDGCDSGTTNPHAHGTYRKPGGGFKTASYSGEICMMHPREITLSINDSTGFDDYLIRNSTLHHELGHAIGSLLDQYKKRYGNAPNVSISGDPEQVPWNRFFSISRYDGRVGIYELFPDCFFPSPNSLMGADSESYYEAYYFDSPSRYSIFENILQMSNQTDDFKWTLDEGDVWKEFLEYDVINDTIPY